MAHTRLDSSAATHLPLCSCGWRGTTTRSLAVAQRQALAHLEAAHGDDRTTRRRRADALAPPNVSGRPA
jgi:hypothetical protein